jgi:molybdopterin molybdotransferase
MSRGRRVVACAYLGLPGNPVSALVSWLLLGMSMLAALEGRASARPAGLPMRIQARLSSQYAPARPRA